MPVAEHPDGFDHQNDRLSAVRRSEKDRALAQLATTPSRETRLLAGGDAGESNGVRVIRRGDAPEIGCFMHAAFEFAEPIPEIFLEPGGVL